MLHPLITLFKFFYALTFWQIKNKHNKNQNPNTIIISYFFHFLLVHYRTWTYTQLVKWILNPSCLPIPPNEKKKNKTTEEIGIEPMSLVLETNTLPLSYSTRIAHTENRTPINGLKDRCSNYWAMRASFIKIINSRWGESNPQPPYPKRKCYHYTTSLFFIYL